MTLKTHGWNRETCEFSAYFIFSINLSHQTEGTKRNEIKSDMVSHIKRGKQTPVRNSCITLIAQETSIDFSLFLASVNTSEKMPCWGLPSLVTLNGCNQGRTWLSDVWFLILHSCKYFRCDMTDNITPIRFPTMIAENLTSIGFECFQVKEKIRLSFIYVLFWFLHITYNIVYNITRCAVGHLNDSLWSAFVYILLLLRAGCLYDIYFIVYPQR